MGSSAVVLVVGKIPADSSIWSMDESSLRLLFNDRSG